MLSGIRGELSSKRVVMFLFVFTFLAVVILNLTLGKTLEKELLEKLFDAMGLNLTLVFGEPLVNRLSGPKKEN
jgi:hypothetical protein